MKINAKELQGAVKMAVRDLVREELRKLLPEVLSEMYVKRLVKESSGGEVVQVARTGLASPKRVQQQQKPAMSPLMRQMIEEAKSTDWSVENEDDEEPVQQLPRSINRQALQEIKQASPFADMIDEETLAAVAQSDMADDGGVPIDEVPVFDFDRMKKVALVGERKNAEKKAIDPEAERQRIEMQRKKLDSMVIKG